MTFLEKLQNHHGRLLRLRSDLYWYDGRGWDNNPDQICLVLNAKDLGNKGYANTEGVVARSRRTTVSSATADVRLLIDGSPQMVWLEEQDVEFLTSELA